MQNNLYRKIVIGTAQFGLNYGISNQTGKVSQNQVCQILDYAAKNHILEIDTAQGYGDSEAVLGEYLKNTVNDFLIQSKFIDDQSLSFTEMLYQSLEHLNVDHLDIFYFHRFEQFKTFKNFAQVKQAKEKGLFKKLGVSLYELSELEIAVSHPEVDAIQIPFNIFDNCLKKIELLKAAKKNNKIIYVRSVFLQGLFFIDPNQLPEKLKSFHQPLIKLKALADKLGFSVQTLCLNYVLNLPFIDRVVIGVDSLEQIKSNVEMIQKIDVQSIQVIEECLAKIEISEPKLLHPVNWN